MKIITFICCLIFFTSCAVVDYPKRALGYSTAKFENETKGRFEIETDLSAQKAYNKCNLFIFEKHLQINFKNDEKLFIVASKFPIIFEYCLDSTEVGIFVISRQDDTSSVEIISNNSNLAKFVSNRLSEYFNK